MAPPEAVQAHFGVSKLQRVILCKRDGRTARNILRPRIILHPRFQSFKRQDLSAGIDELLVIADVIGMMLRIDDIFHRLVRDRPDLFHYPVVVIAFRSCWWIWRIFRIDDDQALSRNPDKSVCSASDDLVEIRLQHLDLFDSLSCGCAGWTTRRTRRQCQSPSGGTGSPSSQRQARPQRALE